MLDPVKKWYSVFNSIILSESKCLTTIGSGLNRHIEPGENTSRRSFWEERRIDEINNISPNFGAPPALGIIMKQPPYNDFDISNEYGESIIGSAAKGIMSTVQTRSFERTFEENNLK